MKRILLSLLLTMMFVLPVSAEIASGDGWSISNAGVLTITKSHNVYDDSWSSYYAKVKKIIITDDVTYIYGEITYNSNITYNQYEGGYYIGNENNPYRCLVKYTGSDLYIHPDTKFIYSSAFSGSGLKSTQVMNGYYYGNKSNRFLVLNSTISNSTQIIIHPQTKYIMKILQGNTQINDIAIPEGVISIADYAFYNCAITQIHIPSSVESIGYAAFAGPTDLARIDVDEKNPIYDSRDNCNAVIHTSTGTLVQGSSSMTIPSGVKTIETASAEYSKGLETLKIPEGVTEIRKWAFKYCTSLSHVELPQSLKTIDDYAFQYCSNLTSITIPNSITSIGSLTFADCTSLTSISIPNSVTSIESSAFSNCSNLTTIYTNIENPSVLKASLGKDKTYIIPTYSSDETIKKFTSAGLSVVRGHNMAKTEAVAETCTTDGNSEYYTCQFCNKYFSEPEATEEIAENSWVIRAHHLDVVIDQAVAATCTATGLKEGSHCEACHTTIVEQKSADALGHSFLNYIYNDDATYDADGTETAICERDGCTEEDSRTAEGTKLEKPTAISAADAKEPGKITKTIENGQIVIIKNGEKYDIAGRKL